MFTFIGIALGFAILGIIWKLADRSMKREAKRWGYDARKHAELQIESRKQKRERLS